ncbi:MAG: PEP-CTERM sorting domain-containing protein [Thiobacillus sp.]
MKYCNHTSIPRLASALALGLSLLAGSAQAAPILSMTIEEIGVASGGVGTSALAGGGGWGNNFDSSGAFLAADAFFLSDGIDGALLMGTTQSNGAMSTGFIWGGLHFDFNTLKSAPGASITGGAMMLNLSGLVAEYVAGNLGFPASPDAGTLVTSVSMIDANHYYYTADWIHVFNNDVYLLSNQAIQPGWNGGGVTLHFEGIATTVPEPGTLWLLGASALGLMLSRRSKRT